MLKKLLFLLLIFSIFSIHNHSFADNIITKTKETQLKKEAVNTAKNNYNSSLQRVNEVQQKVNEAQQKVNIAQEKVNQIEKSMISEEPGMQIDTETIRQKTLELEGAKTELETAERNLEPLKTELEPLKTELNTTSDIYNKTKEVYDNSSASQEDLSSRGFQVNVGELTPGNEDNLKKKSTEVVINMTLGNIIQKLMIGLGSVSLLVMTFGGGYMIFFHGQDELLSKGKSMFTSGIIALIVSLSSYYMVDLLRFILYS